MKVLQIAPAWIHTPPREYGGTEWVIYNLASGLVSLGHEVTLFATGLSESPGKLKFVFRKSFVDQNLPWEAALPPLIHYHQAFKLGSQFDIVHAHLSSQTDLIVLPFISDLIDRHIPAVITIHGHQPFDRLTDSDSQFYRLYAGKIPVINISRSMMRFTPRQFKKAGYVHNSLDISQYKFQPRVGKYLTWLGKIIPDKGTHEAIIIAKEAGEQMIFAGVVDKFQARSVEYFETQVKPLIDGRQIKYLGAADLKLKNKMLGGAKGFLNPIQWSEPFGMVMLESLATGTPVISYSRGAAPELILHNQTGFLVHHRKQMLDSIRLLPSVNRRSCRKRVEDLFTPVAAAQKHVNIYQKIINSFPAATEVQFDASPEFLRR